MVTERSCAICGKIESAERTMAWLAKPATASSTMARVCEGCWKVGEGDNTGENITSKPRGRRPSGGMELCTLG